MRSPLPHRTTRPGHGTRWRAAGVPAMLLAAAGAGFAFAGCGSDGGDLPAVEGPTSPRFAVTATEMSYDPDAVAVAAGEVEVVLRNDGRVLHDLHIDDQPFIVEAGAGEEATGRVTLEPGRYAFYCALPGHRDAGMEGVLEVR